MAQRIRQKQRNICLQQSFRQISGQEDLDVWAQKYFSDDMTEDGLQAAMQGRILSQGIALQEANSCIV